MRVATNGPAGTIRKDRRWQGFARVQRVTAELVAALDRDSADERKRGRGGEVDRNAADQLEGVIADVRRIAREWLIAAEPEMTPALAQAVERAQRAEAERRRRVASERRRRVAAS